MRNRKLKTYTAVSGGSDENPHMRFGVGRNWNFGNFQEEVIALRDLLNDTIEGPAFDRLPKHASSAGEVQVRRTDGVGNRRWYSAARVTAS